MAAPRFPPRSLAVRLFLLLLGGVFAAVFITTGLALHERGRLMQTFREQATAERIADFLHLLAALPADQRSATVEALPSGHWRIEPAAAATPRDDRVSPSFTAALAEAAGPAVRIEAAWRTRPSDCRDPHGACVQARTVGALVRFPDGRRVQVEATREPPPLPLPEGTRFAANLLVLAVALAGISWYAVRLVLQPLRRLAEAAEAFGRDPEHPPMGETGPSEVQQAARTFNRMRERLRAHMDERTRILAAITHDLKTPLTRLRLRLEQCEDEALRARLVDDVAAMQALVGEGLDLARSLDSGPPPQTLDLGALLQSLCDDVADAGGDARFEGPVGALVACRPAALRRALLNLIDNAVVYGGAATVTLEASGGDWVVRIRDQGPGIPDRHLADVMLPFFRLEGSRSRDTGGTGLGLPIAANLTAAQGGTLSLHNLPEGGLEARVRLPVSKRARFAQ